MAVLGMASMGNGILVERIARGCNFLSSMV